MGRLGLRSGVSMRRFAGMVHKEDTGSGPVDVLAAEEFGVPAPDPALRPEVLNLPPDLVADEPHDVLAAEEFAMPSPEEAHKFLKTRPQRAALKVALNLVPLMALWVLRRARRRKKSGTAESE
jgi:hypothetical protein